MGSGRLVYANFIKTDSESNIVADINGVALVVFYNDGNTAHYRNVVLWSGNDSNVADENDTPKGWDETLTGAARPGGGSASLDFIVGDGQTFDDGAVSVNSFGQVPAGGIFQGDSTPAGLGSASGDLWDVKSFPFTSDLLASLSTGPNALEVTSPLAGDCLSLVEDRCGEHARLGTGGAGDSPLGSEAGVEVATPAAGNAAERRRGGWVHPAEVTNGNELCGRGAGGSRPLDQLR